MRFGRGSSSSDSKGKGAGVAILIAVALIALAWILSVVIRFALSRQREYLADAGSIELTKNPDAMISALRKIEGRGELARANSAVMEMCIDNPRVGFSNVFDTHPSIDKRVAAIVKFAGGHDPGPLALPEPESSPTTADETGTEPGTPGPWGEAEPTVATSRSCRRVAGRTRRARRPAQPEPGPWGPHARLCSIARSGPRPRQSGSFPCKNTHRLDLVEGTRNCSTKVRYGGSATFAQERASRGRRSGGAS